MNKIINNFSEKDITYALYGLFLGDGSYKSGKLYISHTDKQKFYSEWLYKIFKDYGLEVKYYSRENKNTTFGAYMYHYTTITVPKRFYFESQEKCFIDNKKIISDYVLNNINSLGLLLWYLDDGNFHVSTSKNRNSTKRFGNLNTQCFTYEENVKIQKMFFDRFGIQVKIHTDTSGFDKNKKYYKIYFSATAFRQFFDLVREYLAYIPKEFYYKFNMKYTPNQLKNSIEFSEKYNLI